MDECEEEGGTRMVAHQVCGAMVTVLAASHSKEAEADFWPSWYACRHLCAEKTENLPVFITLILPLLRKAEHKCWF